MGQKWRKVINKLKWYDFLAIFLVVLGAVLVVVSIVSQSNKERVEVEYLAADDGIGGQKIWVDVAGAVVRPGVYELSGEARIKDVLAASGGLSVEADREFVEKKMNMAEKVKDGQKIFIPSLTPGGMANDEAKVLAGYSDGVLVNINSASIKELDSLWGIGEARANAIVAGRPYGEISELLSRKIVPANVFERIKDKISVY